jgi:hypothetical protein
MQLRAGATAPGSVMSRHRHANIVLISVPGSRVFVADQIAASVYLTLGQH